MAEEVIYKDDEPFPEESEHRPKFSHLRTHFQVRGVHLIHDSINETKNYIIEEIKKSDCGPFKEYIFLDKEKDQSYTLFLGFKYDFEAFKLFTRHPHIRIPGKESGEFFTANLEPTEVFDYLMSKKKESLEKEIEIYEKHAHKYNDFQPYHSQYQTKPYHTYSMDKRRVKSPRNSRVC
jgi:hypothetical protein